MIINNWTYTIIFTNISKYRRVLLEISRKIRIDDPEPMDGWMWDRDQKGTAKERTKTSKSASMLPEPRCKYT